MKRSGVARRGLDGAPPGQQIIIIFIKIFVLFCWLERFFHSLAVPIADRKTKLRLDFNFKIDFIYLDLLLLRLDFFKSCMELAGHKTFTLKRIFFGYLCN